VDQRVSSSSRVRGGLEEALGPAVAAAYRSAFRRRQLTTLAWAWVRRSGLDRRIAEGTDPCHSTALARRAAQLTSNRSRARLAEEIERVLAPSARPAAGSSSALRADAIEVAAAADRLIEIRGLLRSRAPIYARGVAMLRCLLRDGGGPLYSPARRDALNDELGGMIAALEGRDPGQ
jgi:hypothetical protein